MLNTWNRFYLDEATGKLYQSHKILNEPPVAKYLCDYIAREPEQRRPKELPAQCHISLKLGVKMDRDVSVIVEAIGKCTRHVQSLVIDRSKSHVFIDRKSVV